MAFRLIIAAFPEGSAIPALHTCDGADVSPAIEWTGAPSEVKSFALIVDDPDAPGGVWNHWLLFNIPASTHAIAQGFKPGQFGESGTNDFGKPGYNGSCPPPRDGPHRYYFRLYGLGCRPAGGAQRRQTRRIRSRAEGARCGRGAVHGPVRA